MPVSEEELRIILKAVDDASKDLKTIRDSIGDVGISAGTAHPEVKSISDALEKLKDIAVVVVATKALKTIGEWFQSIARDAIESVGAFEAMAKSAQALMAVQMMTADSSLSMDEAMNLVKGDAQGVTEWMKTLGIESTLTAESIRDLWTRLVTSGFTAKEAQDVTEAMADIVAGMNVDVTRQNRIAYALGQIASHGYLARQELRQLAEAGMGMQVVADMLGMSIEDLDAAITGKEISAQELFAGIITWSGRFAGMGKEMAATWQYIPQTLQEIKDLGLQKIFGEYNIETGEMTGILGDLQPLMQELIKIITSEDFLNALAEFGKTISSIAPENIEILAEDLPSIVEAITTLAPALAGLAGPGMKEGLTTFTSLSTVGAEFVNVADAIAELMSTIINPTGKVNTRFEHLIEYLKLLADWTRPLDNILKWFADRLGEVAEGIDLVRDAYIKWRAETKESEAEPGKKFSEFQHGTSYAPGGWAMVGERGPELVRLPRGSAVYPSEQTQGMMGGVVLQFAAGAFVIHAPTREGEAIGRAIGGGILEAMRAGGQG